MPSDGSREPIKNWVLLKLILCESTNIYRESSTNNANDSNKFFNRFRTHQHNTECHKALQLSHIAEQINMPDTDASIKLIALCSALFNPTLRHKIKNILDSEALKNCVANLLIQGKFSRSKGVETNTLQSTVFSQHMINESISHCTNTDEDEISYDKLDAIKYILMLINDKIELDPTAKKLFDAFHAEYSSQLNTKTDNITLATEVNTRNFGYNNLSAIQAQTGQVVSQTPL